MRLINKYRKITSLALLVALVFCTLASIGCNTFNGLGKDIEKGGQKMQNATGTQPQEW